MCRNDGFSAEVCRPNQATNASTPARGGFSPAFSSVPSPATQQRQAANMARWGEPEIDIYGVSPRPPRPRQLPSAGGASYFENDITPSAPAGPPNPGLIIGGVTPADTRGPGTPVTVNDIYDPQGLININDPNALNVDDILFGPGVRHDDIAQVEPRFPLADEPWDGAAFMKEAYWDSTFKTMRRFALLSEIIPDAPEPPPDNNGCDEEQLAQDRNNQFDNLARCGKKPTTTWQVEFHYKFPFHNTMVKE